MSGSGSISNDIGIVTVQEELQTYLVHLIGLRERKRLSDETCQTLAQGIVPPLHVRQLSAFLAHRLVVIRWDYRSLCLPESTVASSASLAFGNPLPQPTT